MSRFTEEQNIKLKYIKMLFDNVLIERDMQEELLFVVLNDVTEESSRDRVTLMSFIMDDSITGRQFELVASLGVEILVNSINYMNLRNRVKEAILEKV